MSKTTVPTEPDEPRPFRRRNKNSCPAPPTTREPLPPAIGPEALRSQLDISARTVPIDPFSYAAEDQTMKATFKSEAAFEDQQRAAQEQDAGAMLTLVDAGVRAAEGRVDEAARAVDRVREELTNEHARLNGEDPPDDEILDPVRGTTRQPKPPTDTTDGDRRKLRALIGVPTLIVRVVAVLLVGWGFGVDWVNFASAIQLINRELSTDMNNLLASGVTAAVAVMSVKIGRKLGQAGRGGTLPTRAGKVRSVIALTAFGSTLTAIIGMSFAIRIAHPSSATTNPFGMTVAAKSFSWFDTGGGFLPAAFFTTILVASALATIDEARVAAKFGPYLRAIVQERRASRALRKAQEWLTFLLGRRTDWTTYSGNRVAARDRAIAFHATQIDLLFVYWRRLVATHVGDAAVTDTMAYAPTIDLMADMPLLDPPFSLVADTTPTLIAESA